MPEGAPSDRHARSVVTGGVWVGGSQRLLPVLRTPFRRVGGIYGDHGDPGFGGHRQQSSPKFRGGHARDDLPEPATPAVLLPRFRVGEVEVFHRDHFDAAVFSPTQQLGERVTQLGVTMIRASTHVITEALRRSDRIAVPIQTPRGQVIGVHVHPDQLPGAESVKWSSRDRFALPGRMKMPAAGGRIVMDTVGDSVIARDPISPFIASVREPHSPGQDVAVVWRVRQMGQRPRESD